jgi:hypothetical protein
MTLPSPLPLSLMLCIRARLQSGRKLPNKIRALAPVPLFGLSKPIFGQRRHDTDSPLRNGTAKQFKFCSNRYPVDEYAVLAFLGTVHGSFHSLYTLSCVSRSAGSHSLNLRGQRLLSVVPANGCLATLLMRWSRQRIEDSSLCKNFIRREHLPPSRGKSPFPLDCYLSWTSLQTRYRHSSSNRTW